jgi:hypothetical protein
MTKARKATTVDDCSAIGNSLRPNVLEPGRMIIVAGVPGNGKITAGLGLDRKFAKRWHC